MDTLRNFKANAIIFDKDGTLIDFDAMWGGWALILAENLTALCGADMRAVLCEAMGYDLEKRKVLADGKLAATPMHLLYDLTVDVVIAKGFAKETAQQLVEEAWVIPEPVELAKPFTDMEGLFHHLHRQGIKLALATTDDRAPTQAMLDAFDVGDYIETMVCSDDGIPAKPAPDMVLTICQRLGVDPAHVMVIGDTTADLKMARAAGAGLVVGVLCGVSSAKDLIPHADILIESVDELHTYSLVHANEAAQPLSGLNPDLAT
ncbi:MAG TPA: HAD family hydrolase [Anaerolineales bacterium]|nr:HAD family hydrolase [Anaerolineales bacterium]